MNPLSGALPLFSFPKQQRLLRRPEFTATMDQGTKFVTPYLVALGVRTEGKPSRIGFIVSKRVGDAVTRNRVRRRLRELFRTLPNKPKNMDLVIIARPPAAQAEFAELSQTFSFALMKLEQRLERDARSAGGKPAAQTDSGSRPEKP